MAKHSLRKRTLAPLAAAVFGLVLGGSGLAAGVAGGGFAPVELAPEPGPEMVVGAEDGHSAGTHFDWVDAVVSGPSERYRVYFDRLDNENFHYLDRAEQQFTVGLCEAGVEQVLSRGEYHAPESEAVRVARHGSKIGVFAGSRLILAAFDDRRVGGTVGVRNLGSGAPLSLVAQRREDIRFSDDFMREEKDASTWRKVRCGPDRGDFAIKSLRNPLMSANAFAYLGNGRDVLSVTGERWWDNYRFETSLRGPDQGRIGVVFAYQDDRNYGLFRWTARPYRTNGSSTGPGLRELVRVRDGQEEVLASSAYGYLPHQWYRAEVLVTNARVRIAVDGHPFFEVQDPCLAAGAVGLWCDVARPKTVALDPKATELRQNSLWDLMNQHAAFDDVLVASIESFEDDFRTPGPLAHGWLAGTGRWEVTAAAGQAGDPGELQVSNLSGPTKSLIGNARWGQYRLACDLDPDTGLAGLLFLYRDEANYFLARTDGQNLELLKVADGREETLGKVALKDAQAARKDGFLRLGISAKEGFLRVTASDGTAVEGFEAQGSLHGRAGLYAAPAAVGKAPPVRFRRFRLLFLEEPEPLVTSNAIFEDEESMSDWSNQAKEWLPQQTPITVDGQNVIPLWHSCLFPGDVELVVEPRQVLDPRHELALSLSKDGKGGQNGYVFLYQGGRTDEKGAKFSLLKILRQGEPVAERVLEGGAVRELSSLSFRRAGPYLIGKVNGRPELVYRDPQPLTGAKVAYYGKGVAMRMESSRILSDHCLNEVFSRAPVDWRLAGSAIAEVTNRWQCDPRWSFFSLKNDRSLAGKAAVLWSKYLYPGDVSIEFFVGNKMEQERGAPYTYARDINVTICSDGNDLTKGYSFCFGGHGNEATYIYRNGVEVKRVERVIPTEQRIVHHAWMLVHVEKRGSRVTLHVDRLPGEPPIDVSFDDPQPLAGDRVAIWTYNHAIMLSRVRVSGEGGTVKESPDQEFFSLKTIYDSQ